MKALLALLPVIFIAGCIGQGEPSAPAFSDGLTLSQPIVCENAPDISREGLCRQSGTTTISTLNFVAASATGFSCVDGRFSGTCITRVTDGGGIAVLSGSSQGSSACEDNRILCQVPIDAANMPAGDYLVAFTVTDDNSGMSLETSLDITIV